MCADYRAAATIDAAATRAKPIVLTGLAAHVFRYTGLGMACHFTYAAHVTLATEDSDDTVLAIHEALEKLARESAQQAQIVKLRYFGGLSVAETAAALLEKLST